MEKLLKEFYDFTMDEGTGMIREDDINSFLELKGQQPSLDLHDLIKLNKSDMTAIICDKMEQLDEGWIDTVDLFIYAKKLEYMAAELVKAVKDKVDPSKFGTGYIKYNVELVGRNSAGSWDFSNCNYKPLEEAVSEVKFYTERVKQHQEFLKALKEPVDLLDKDTGEVITILPPPPKTGKLGPVATLK